MQLPASITYEWGVHLRGTPLWFDAERPRPLCVLTCLGTRKPPLHERIVTSTALAEALVALGYRGTVLPTPLGRKVGVGGEEIRLIDVGVQPGCSAALIERRGERLLVAGSLVAAPVSWPRVDHIVARAAALGHQGLDLAAGVSAIVARVAQHAASGEARVMSRRIVVESISAGLALVEAFRRQGVAAEPLGPLAKLVPPDPAASLEAQPEGTEARSDTTTAAEAISSPTCCERPAEMPRSSRKKRTQPLGVVLARVTLPRNAQFIWVDTGLGAVRACWSAGRQSDPVVPLRFYADASALHRLIAMTGAQRVSLVDVGVRELAELRDYYGPRCQLTTLRTAQQLPLAAQAG